VGVREDICRFVDFIKSRAVKAPQVPFEHFLLAIRNNHRNLKGYDIKGLI
jgi:hypothetical protein